jgi:DNA-binding transcriptional LysR family regulator
MSKLPDLEGLAIFAKVVEIRSFVGAAAELGLSKATVSKAVSRVETRLGARLFNRTSRRFALTDAGKMLAERAARILAEGEAAENDALAQSTTPRGRIRLAAPMSFGVSQVAALLPDFFALYPEVSVDLHLSDATVDLIGEGFDAALRIAVMPDSSLVARRLCGIVRHVLAAPSYLDRHGRPAHPLDLAQHQCLSYAYLHTSDTWHFSNAAGEQASVRASGRLRVNNGDALMPALIAGLGIAELPEFIAGDAIRDGRLEIILKNWTMPQSALHFVTPSAGPRPARIDALADFLAKRLSRPSWHAEEKKLRRSRAR